MGGRKGTGGDGRKMRGPPRLSSHPHVRNSEKCRAAKHLEQPLNFRKEAKL